MFGPAIQGEGKMRIQLAVLALSACVAIPAAAVDFFVLTTGSDGNSSNGGDSTDPDASGSSDDSAYADSVSPQDEDERGGRSDGD